MNARLRAAALGAAFLAMPLPAAAHLASTGLGPVYDGAWHLLLAPAQLATLATLALFAGRRGPAAARRSFLLIPVVWLIAWSASPVGPGAAAVAVACAMLVAGLLLASDAPLGPLATPVAACVIAAMSSVGYDGPLAPANAVGALAVVLVVLALLSSVSLPAQRGAVIVAMRVAGSWTAALGLLLVGWWVHGWAV